MELLIGFATDDGKHLKGDHIGKSKYFYVYRFIDEREEFIERRENVKYEGDESMIHGDPKKAKATSTALKGLDGVVGRRFGPNIVRLLKKFVCIVVRRETIDDAIDLIHRDMDKVIEAKEEGEGRKHLVLS
jgi:predicted Fe-Mo cluster-binding NifX family protein